MHETKIVSGLVLAEAVERNSAAGRSVEGRPIYRARPAGGERIEFEGPRMHPQGQRRQVALDDADEPQRVASARPRTGPPGTRHGGTSRGRSSPGVKSGGQAPGIPTSTSPPSKRPRATSGSDRRRPTLVNVSTTRRGRAFGDAGLFEMTGHDDPRTTCHGHPGRRRQGGEARQPAANDFRIPRDHPYEEEDQAGGAHISTGAGHLAPPPLALRERAPIAGSHRAAILRSRIRARPPGAGVAGVRAPDGPATIKVTRSATRRSDCCRPGEPSRAWMRRDPRQSSPGAARLAAPTIRRRIEITRKKSALR